MRAIRSIGVAALLAVTSPAVAGDDDFGPAQARALIPRAAAGRGGTLAVMSALGGALTPTDVRAAGSVPLTHLLLLAPVYVAPDWMCRSCRSLASSPLTVTDVLPVLYGAPLGGSSRDAKHDFPSLLHDEYLTHVDCTRRGDTAGGRVHFEIPGVCAGTVLWSARRGASGWEIVEFLVPSWRVRVRKEAWSWIAENLDDPQGPWFPTPEHLAIPGARLPRTGVVADTPRGALEVGIAADGTLLLRGREGGLEDLRGLLDAVARGPRQREPDGSSKLDLVVRFDTRVPWTLVQWVLQTAAGSPARIHRVYFAVAPETGGADGVIAAFLPKDRGGLSPFVPAAGVRATLVAAEGLPDRGAVFAAIRKAVEAGAKIVEIETPLPDVPRAGHVVSVLDLALREGAARVDCSGAPAPIPRAGGDRPRPAAPPAAAEAPGSLPWLRAYVAAWSKEHADGCAIRIGGAPVPGAPATTPLPAPPPRIRLDADGRVPHEETPSDDVVPPDPEEEVPPTPEETEDIGGRDRLNALPGARDPGAAPPNPAPPPDGLLSAGGGSPRAFASRGAHGARSASSGDAARDRALEAALTWLAAHQSADGGWEAEGFAHWCDGKLADARADGAGKPHYDVGVTGLALLAFLGEGYTMRSEGPFGAVVGRGLRYLRNVQDAEGCFGPRSTGHFVYNHALAALAVIEAYGMTGSAPLKGPAQNALDFIAIARNPYAGWRYGIKPADNDTSVTGWMAMALQSARWINAVDAKAGRPASLAVLGGDEDAFEGVRAWLDRMTDPATGRVGYQVRGTGPARPVDLVDRFPATKSESMTAIAVFLRIALGEDPTQSEPVRKGAELLRRLPPVWNPADGSIDFYAWHAGSLALFQVGGEAWAAWKQALDAEVVAHQRTDGDPCGVLGSWDPIDPWGPDGGRVYATAILALALETPYRYERIAAAGR
jgi:hypothetical protein